MTFGIFTKVPSPLPERAVQLPEWAKVCNEVASLREEDPGGQLCPSLGCGGQPDWGDRLFTLFRLLFNYKVSHMNYLQGDRLRWLQWRFPQAGARTFFKVHCRFTHYFLDKFFKKRPQCVRIYYVIHPWTITCRALGISTMFVCALMEHRSVRIDCVLRKKSNVELHISC